MKKANLQEILDSGSQKDMKILANWWDLPPTVGQILGRRKYGGDGPVHRPEPRLPRRGRAGEPRRAAQPAGAGDRRAGHWQGTDRRTSSPSLVALGRPADYHELRGAAGKSDRGRAVRP